MPLVEQHEGNRPDSCEVCHYLESHPELDRRYQHTLTILAGWMLQYDLLEANGQPLAMRSIYVESFAGDAPGRSVALHPQHWLLALVAAPEIKLELEDREGARS